MKRKNTVLYRFDTRYPFDFVAPYSLEQCVEILKAEYTAVGWFGRTTDFIEIILIEQKDNPNEYKMGMRQTKQMNAVLKGYLRSINDHQTRVTGYVRLARSHLLFLGFMISVGFVPLILVHQNWIGAVYVLLFVYFYLGGLFKKRNTAVQSISDILLYGDRRKRKNT